jgi:hypothetical protein
LIGSSALGDLACDFHGDIDRPCLECGVSAICLPQQEDLAWRESRLELVDAQRRIGVDVGTWTASCGRTAEPMPVVASAIDPTVRRVLLPTQRLQQLLDGYPPEPGLQPGWRWCDRCHGLYYGPRVATSVCPASGAHRPATESGSPTYGVHLADPPPPGSQPGWKWCNRCQGLVFGGVDGARVGACPASGGHDHTGSGAYSLRHGQPPHPGGQADWRWCSKCEALYFGARYQDSKYPVTDENGNNQHGKAISGYYGLMFASDG